VPTAERPSLEEPLQTSLALQPKRQAPVTVLFDLNSARLIPPAEALLGGVGEGTKVSVAGHACELGTASRNLLLSQRRAEAVAAYLRGRGVLVETVEGKGECCPASGRLELNRRVEVKPTQKEE
jgi:outer membrane protein OmpA-like peptidoglycan-associated protein